MVANLQPGVIVKGRFGPLVDVIGSTDDDDMSLGVPRAGKRKNRRHRSILEGQILHSLGPKMWLVRFEDGIDRECHSKQLKYEFDPAFAVNDNILTASNEEKSTLQCDNTCDTSIDATTAITNANTSPTDFLTTTTNITTNSIQATTVNASETNTNNISGTASINTDTNASRNSDREAFTQQDLSVVDQSTNMIDVNIVDTTEDDISIDEDDIEEIREGLVGEYGSDDDAGFDAVFDGEYSIYETRKRDAEGKRAELIRNSFKIKKANGKGKQIEWKAVECSTPSITHYDFEKLGVREMKWELFNELRKKVKENASKTTKRKCNFASPSSKQGNLPTPFFDLFMLLWPGDWQQQLHQLNVMIDREHQNKSKNGKIPKKITSVSQNEFFVFIGVIISAGPAGRGGRNLFQSESEVRKNGINLLLPLVNFENFMKYYRFNDIRSKFHLAFDDIEANAPSSSNFDPWHNVSKLIRQFNENRFCMVAASRVKVQDESMSAWKPRKDKTGGLPNISFIKRKPEPLGTEFKSAGCGQTGIMLSLEIQRGKHEIPKRSKYHQQFGATTSCAVRCTTDTSNCGQQQHDHRPNIFYGDSWFASVKTADAIVDFGHEFVGPVKTAHSLFPKDELESTMKDWPGGTHLIMEGTSPSNNELLAIGYKYNSKKVLSFVATKDAGSTLPGDPYRARFVGDDKNVRARRVERPQVISDYFKYSNVVDKHNHARQYELKLEKHWVTLNCYFRIITTIIGITVVDCWKCYRYKFGDSEYTVCKFAEQIAYEMLHNNKSNAKRSLEMMSPLESKTARRSPRRCITVQEKDQTSMSPLTETRLSVALV